MKVHTNSFTVAINITGLDVKVRVSLSTSPSLRLPIIEPPPLCVVILTQPLLLPQEELKAAGSIEDVAKEIGLVEEE